MSKMTHLTKSQQRAQQHYINQGIARVIGTRVPATEECPSYQADLETNPEKLNEAIRSIYRLAGLAEPDKVVITNGPTQFQKLAYQDEGAVWKSVERVVKDDIWSDLWCFVQDNVWKVIGIDVRNAVNDDIWKVVDEVVENAVKDAAKECDFDYTPRYDDASSVAEYLYIHEFLSVEFPDDVVVKLYSLRDVLDAGLWGCKLYKNTAYILTRPEEMHLDTDGKPHSLTGPAIKWLDGTALHFRYGERYNPIPTATMPKPIVFTAAIN